MHEARERTGIPVLYCTVQYCTGTVQNSTGSVTTVPITGVPCPLCPLMGPGSPRCLFTGTGMHADRRSGVRARARDKARELTKLRCKALCLLEVVLG